MPTHFNFSPTQVSLQRIPYLARSHGFGIRRKILAAALDREAALSTWLPRDPAVSTSCALVRQSQTSCAPSPWLSRARTFESAPRATRRSRRQVAQRASVHWVCPDLHTRRVLHANSRNVAARELAVTHLGDVRTGARACAESTLSREERAVGEVAARIGADSGDVTLLRRQTRRRAGVGQDSGIGELLLYVGGGLLAIVGVIAAVVYIIMLYSD
ncbi:hypothetical protein C8R43DRAFT_1236918 [Mycena crocata]|nr:hypothetical protein C8R43DRAFT_1236918 [Mycena crocata]